MNNKKINFALINGLDLMKVSLILKNRSVAPSCLCQEVGEYQGRYYMLDFTTNIISRLTLGAYQHLRSVWNRQATTAI